MPVHLFLNERSCESDSSAAEVADGMAEFVALLRSVRRQREVDLTTKWPLADSELARGYLCRQWMADTRNRDQWRFILALRNRSPYRSVLSGGQADLVEYRHNGETVEGIGAAHLLDGLSVSLPLDARWSGSWLEVTAHRLVETEEGDLAEKQTQELVRHSARVADVASHAEWIGATGVNELTTGLDLWQARNDFFPSLDFLARVERDLERLDHRWIIPVRRLLIALEASIMAWDPAVSPFPTWQSPHITPEAEQRKRLCYFEDTDGVRRCFDLHGRVTPGAGRVHFRLVPEQKSARIAYIGPKL